MKSLYTLWYTLLFWLASGCALAHAVKDDAPLQPAHYAFVPLPPSDRYRVEALHSANAVLQGSITKIEADWRYDDPCGVIATAMRRCNGTRAYQVTVATTRGDATFFVFVPHNDYQPLTLGLSATFVLSKQWINALQRCHEVRALTSTACSTLGHLDYVLLTTDNIWPIDAVTDAVVEK